MVSDWPIACLILLHVLSEESREKADLPVER